MDKETIKKNWGKRFSKFFRKTKYFRNEFKIIQKDLASTLKISENTITQWKQGKLDIKLTSIYEVVTYIKEKYPDSSPMLLLFSDLLVNEIKREVEIKNKEFIEDFNELKKTNLKLEAINKRLNAKINNITPEYERNKKDLEALRVVFKAASPYIRNHFYESLIPKDIFFRNF